MITRGEQLLVEEKFIKMLEEEQTANIDIIIQALKELGFEKLAAVCKHS